MLRKKNDDNELHPDTVLCELESFRVIEHGSNKECIYIRGACDCCSNDYMIVDNNGRYNFTIISSSDTIGSFFGYDKYSVYKCKIDNIDIEYH